MTTVSVIKPVEGLRTVKVSDGDYSIFMPIDEAEWGGVERAVKRARFLLITRHARELRG